jgi:hypothetical protein
MLDGEIPFIRAMLKITLANCFFLAESSVMTNSITVSSMLTDIFPI